MELTLNGTPILVDDIAAREIVLRHLLGIVDEPSGSEALAMTVKATGTPELQKGEKLIGSYAGPDGKTTIAILLPGSKSKVNWKDAMIWAKDQGGYLPNRIEALLLFLHHRAAFEKDDVLWTGDESAGYSDYAWLQYFLNGHSDYWRKDDKYMARAVRRVTI